MPPIPHVNQDSRGSDEFFYSLTPFAKFRIIVIVSELIRPLLLKEYSNKAVLQAYWGTKDQG